MKKNLYFVLSTLVILSIFLSGCASTPEANTPEAAGEELETITIVADWPTAWVGFIPWLVAEEKGFYAEEGLTVETILPATVADPPKYVALGKADFAFTTQLDVILGRAAGIPIVSTAAVFRYNNWGIIVPEDGAKELKDIKTLSLYENTWDHSCFNAMVANEGLNLEDFEILPSTSDTVPLFLAGKVDAIGGITNAEQTELKITGGRDTNIFLARDYGVPDVYVYVFASSNQFLEEHPETANKFMSATLKGLQYSVEHPDEALAIFKKLYPEALSEEYAAASWEATVPVFETDNYGYQDPALWDEVQTFMFDNGLIETTSPSEELFTNEFIAE